MTLIATGVAGCSSEASRFNDGSYRTSSGEVTGSIPSGQAAPVGQVETRPLIQSQPPSQPPQQYSRITPAPVSRGGGSAGGGPGIASYNPGAPAYAAQPAPVGYEPPPTAASVYHPQPNPEVTGSVVAPGSVVRKPPEGHWTWDGGTAVTVTPGETVDSIARRYGVPPSAIIEANGLSGANAIRSGQRLVIPRYVTRGSSVTASLTPPAAAPSHVAPPPPKPAPAPVAAGPINSGVHVVAPGETLSKIARRYGKTVAELAKANNIPAYSKVSVGDRIVIPGIRTGSLKPEVVQPSVQAKIAPPATTKDKDTAGGENVAVVTPAQDPVGGTKADATPGFRWPVRGRIIAAFGPKPNGQQNDGIDVAVPENTPIKAAEDGEVAYAGNELKGFGNLVLIKHPNGYVTAYAHAKELMVKRGDTIKRGQVIGKSGQSGNADVPELHFEVRKGSAAVDPMQFLGGA